MESTSVPTTGAGPVQLECRDLEKSYRTPHQEVQVLRGIDLRLQGGESLAITGPSGSGKSTLLQILGTLDQPTGGEVEINGQHPFRLSEPELARFRNQTVGFVFQDHHLLPQYSVLENVLLPTLAHAGESRPADTRARALELLERVRLGHRLEHRPAELSGGERQRVAVARALINQPSLLLCDEPTGSLDQATAEAVGDLLLELHGAERILVVVTHSLDLAARFPRRVELREGSCYEP